MNSIDKAIKTCDAPYIKIKEIESIINDLENLSARVKSVAENDNEDSPTLNRSAQDIKEVANRLRLYASKKRR